jgi:hypothetical protein
MNEAILDLIESYKRRILALDSLLAEANDNLSKVRLGTKKSVYQDVIRELQYLVKDENHS